jgi:hypothetical protein
MKDISKLETLVASWYKDLPHLPKPGQKWLAQNVWWLALVGVILGAMGVFGVLSVTLFASAALVAIGGGYGAVVGSVAFIAVLVFLALAVVCLVLTGMAVTPLKAGHKKGWNLLFIVALINVASLIISFLGSFNLLGLVWGLLMTAVGVYFLFEIRSYFIEVKSSAKKTA